LKLPAEILCCIDAYSKVSALRFDLTSPKDYVGCYISVVSKNKVVLQMPLYFNSHERQSKYHFM